MGDEDDKPFACNVTGCTMKFVNEDHLTVHKKKHEMSLSLNTPSIFKEPYVDQTPTPTRLLKNCHELGLFQDLGIHTNPFDEQFRKAAQSGTSLVSTTELLQQDSLNTPNVPPLTCDVALPVSSTTDADMLETSCNIPRPSTVLPEPEPTMTEETMPFDPGSASCDPDVGNPVVVEEYDLADVENQTVPAVIVKSSKEVVPGIRSIVPRKVVQMPVITSVSTLRQNQQALIKPKGPVATKQVVLVTKAVSTTTSTQPVITIAAPAPVPVTTTVIQPTPASSSSGVTTSANNAPMIQLIVKLEGQSMPFNIPLPALAPSVPAARIIGSSNTLTVQPSPVISSARDVLKGAVEEKMSRKGVPLVVNHVNPISSGSQTQMLGPKHHTTIGTVNPNNPVAAVQPTVRTTISSGRKRKDSDEDDPQEKRRRFLERNRAAATRCRLKKKKWVDELESKCKELTAHNNQLQKEVSILRIEVANLKTLLLSHKDCPITQQQMKTSGQQHAVFPLSALASVCESSLSSPQSVASMRTIESGSQMGGSPVVLETIQLDCASDDDQSMDDSNDGSVQGGSEF